MNHFYNFLIYYTCDFNMANSVCESNTNILYQKLQTISVQTGHTNSFSCLSFYQDVITKEHLLVYNSNVLKNINESKIQYIADITELLSD